MEAQFRALFPASANTSSGPEDQGLVNTILAQNANQYALLLLLALCFILPYGKGVYSASTSPLRHIPGPWYAPYTTLHLRWMFARGTVWKYVKENHAIYGDVIRLGPRQIWVADKEAMKEILVTVDLPKVAMYAEISRDRRSPGLFGEIREKPHTKLRRFLGPAFTVSSVDKLDYYFKNCVGKLIDNYYSEVEKTSEVKTDLMRDLHCVALDIMGESAFGRGFGQIEKVFDPSKIKTKQDKAWAKIPDAIFDGQTKRYQMVFVKRLIRKLGIDLKFSWPKSMVAAISELVDDRRSGATAPPPEQDVLQHMLDDGNRPDSGEVMSNQDIIDQMSELLLAGSETTSGTIGCLFLELARNPEVKKKLLDSLPVLGPEDPIFDSKSVREESRFTYLEACIKENLRKHPIASELGRRNGGDDINLAGYLIPSHTVVSASYRNLHLDERYWPQADRFWPERWLEGEERGDAPEPDMDTYYPFSGGKHSCIGRNFAYAEIRTVSANILSRFDVLDVIQKPIDFRQFITMQFTDGKWPVTLKPRWK